MKYFRVEWVHNFNDEPIYLYHECDDANYETKKIEIFRNGLIGYADEDYQINGSVISEEKIPSINEIAQEEEFRPEEITKEEFYRVFNEKVKPYIVKK